MTIKLFGGTNVGTTDGVPGYCRASQYTCAQTGWLTEVHVYCRANSNIRVAVYSDAADSVGNLLGESSSQAVTATGFKGATLASPVAVTQGTKYWLASQNTVAGGMSYRTVTWKREYKTHTYGAFPANGTGWLVNTDLEYVHQGWGTPPFTAYTKTYTADALFKKLGLTKTYTADAIIKLIATQSVDVDAIIKLIATQSVDADALFKALGLTETLDADTLLKKLGILETVDVDALLQKGFTKTFLAKAILGGVNIAELTADALFKALGLTQTLDADALLQQQDITETVDVDALIKLIATQSIDADALLRATLSQTVDADALLLKGGLTKTADVDALFLKSVTEAILADLLLQKAPTQGVDVDALIKKLGITKAFTADVRLGEMGIEVFTASVYFKRLAFHVILDAQYITETPEVNRAYVIGRDAEGNPVHGTDLEQAEIDLVGERLDFQQHLSIPSTLHAGNVADAMLKKQRLSKHRGFIAIPPNAGAELWDVIQVTDKLCAQSATKYRVLAITFDYQPRQHRYQHKLFLGAR